MSRTGLSESLQLHWQRSPLAQRWQTLPARDRLALVALSVFLLLVLFYLALWQPVQRQAQAARAAFEEQRALYAYMQSRAPQVQGRDLQPRASLDPARALKDPKTALQEWLQGRRMPLPRYSLADTRGEAHQQEFEVECEIAGLGLKTRGIGVSRRAAEQQSAQRALELLPKS